MLDGAWLVRKGVRRGVAEEDQQNGLEGVTGYIARVGKNKITLANN